MRPLTRLTHKDAQFDWTPDCAAAFVGVRHALTHAQVLAMPEYGQPFEVVCDASLAGLGAVLMQNGRPIAYESRALKPAEVKYTTTDQELLAVVHAMGTWRCFLEEVKCTVVTDHCPLT